MRLTRAVTHIRLTDTNHAKIAALDAVAATYMALCQQYMTYFCTEADPDKYADPCFVSPLSQRWQRTAIQQAAGIAQSWRTNHAAAYQEYLDALAAYQETPATLDARAGVGATSANTTPTEDPPATLSGPPTWQEWNTPLLKETAIQANANVALLEPANDSPNGQFDYWLRFSTLERGQPVFLPVQLAEPPTCARRQRVGEQYGVDP
jgi:hypothetical protein